MILRRFLLRKKRNHHFSLVRPLISLKPREVLKVSRESWGRLILTWLLTFWRSSMMLMKKTICQMKTYIVAKESGKVGD